MVLYSGIIDRIRDILNITKDEQSALKDFLIFKKVQKREILQEEGDVANAYYYVISGCLRAYVKNHKGIDQVVQFSPGDTWIADQASILYNKPSTITIEASLESEILVLTKEGKEESIAKIPRLAQYYSMILEKSVVFLRDRLIDVLSKTAEERYLLFRESYPSIIEGVSQKHIASYLGVTPEFFSYMKKKLKEKGAI